MYMHKQEVLKNAVKQFKISEKNIMLYEIKDNKLSTKFQNGDIVVIDTSKSPTLGNFTLLEHKNKQRLIWILDIDDFDRYIVCEQYSNYPLAKVLYKKNFIGAAVGVLNPGGLFGVYLGFIYKNNYIK